MEGMTGIGKGCSIKQNLSVDVILKSVNHRSLDFHLNLPPYMIDWEPALRSKICNRFKRGHIEAVVEIRYESASPITYHLSDELLGSLKDIIDKASRKFIIEDKINISQIFSIPGLITSSIEEECVSEAGKALLEAFDKALDSLLSMRQREGEGLVNFFNDGFATLKGIADEIKSLLPVIDEVLKNSYKSRIFEISGCEKCDVERLLLESAILVEKADVREEVLRISFYIDSATGLARKNSVSGKEIDFMLQEISREFNTILSKSKNVSLSALALKGKATVETLREQTFNIQ